MVPLVLPPDRRGDVERDVLLALLGVDCLAVEREVDLPDDLDVRFAGFEVGIVQQSYQKTYVNSMSLLISLSANCI